MSLDMGFSLYLLSRSARWARRDGHSSRPIFFKMWTKTAQAGLSSDIQKITACLHCALLPAHHTNATSYPPLWRETSGPAKSGLSLNSIIVLSRLLVKYLFFRTSDPNPFTARPELLMLNVECGNGRPYRYLYAHGHRLRGTRQGGLWWAVCPADC